MNKILDIKIENDLIEFTFESDYIANSYTTRLSSLIRLNFGLDKNIYSSSNKLCVSGDNSCDAVDFIKREIENIKSVF